VLIVNKSSAGNGTIVIDGESKTVRTGRNVFYLAVGTSHQIQNGTTKIGYSAPECGENTINTP
jgi:mannose-6-phosphate isomerase-like protein (cupin superfamily)